MVDPQLLQKRKIRDEKFVLTLKEFAIARATGGEVLNAMSNYLEASSELPPVSLEYWEQIIRDELSADHYIYRPAGRWP
jgi:hypothetical protein